MKVKMNNGKRLNSPSDKNKYNLDRIKHLKKEKNSNDCRTGAVDEKIKIIVRIDLNRVVLKNDNVVDNPIKSD